MMLVLSGIVLINSIVTLVVGQSTAIVRTTTGPVQGQILKTAINSVPYAAFKGIKYAEAPVGFLRFKPPVPVRPWTGTLNATSEGNVCPQFYSPANIVIGSEDCLFLNVFTPVTNLSVAPRVLKAVMVWIHGGMFMFGSGSTQIQRPDYLLEKDVVFVSFNYRLGVLGFLSLDHRNATGNAGLKDQNLALKWVKANIGKFGGNPNSVTIFGNCAGSVSVGYHTISKVSAGLFRSAISMSGTPLAPWAFQPRLKALSVAQQYARALGIRATDKETLLNTFYKATPAQLVTARMSMAQQYARALGTRATDKETLLNTFDKATAAQLIPALMSIAWVITLTPTTEDSTIATQPFLTETPYVKYYKGDYQKVPQLLGFMDQEAVSFTHSLPAFLEVINLALEKAQKIGIELPANLTTVRDLIIFGGNLNQVDKAIVQAAINITSQIGFISATDRTQRFFAANNNKKSVYYYHISFSTNQSLHNLPGPNIITGPGHMDDLAYIFYIPSANYSTNPTDPVARTISRITTMWTNFAKVGNPGSFWPESSACGNALNIGNELSVGPRPINQDIELLELLSWPDEKKSLGNPGFIRPAWGG